MITSKSIRLIIHVLLIVFGLIWVYPFIWMLFSSFKTNAEFLTEGTSLLPEVFMWENYSNAWNNANFSGYFLNTIVFTVSVVIIVIILSSLTGYVLGRLQFPGRNLIMISVVATMFIPKGYTIIPLYQIISGMGLANTMFGVILAESSGAHVLFILMFASFFNSIPKELMASAEIDGAGFLRTFFRIMLLDRKSTRLNSTHVAI